MTLQKQRKLVRIHSNMCEKHEKMVDFISPTCKQEKLLFHAILSVGYVQQTPSSTTPS